MNELWPTRAIGIVLSLGFPPLMSGCAPSGMTSAGAAPATSISVPEPRVIEIDDHWRFFTLRVDDKIACQLEARQDGRGITIYEGINENSIGLYDAGGFSFGNRFRAKLKFPASEFIQDFSVNVSNPKFALGIFLSDQEFMELKVSLDSLWINDTSLLVEFDNGSVWSFAPMKNPSGGLLFLTFTACKLGQL